MVNKISLNKIKQIFESNLETVKIETVLNTLIAYIRQDDVMPAVVNSLVREVKKLGKTDNKIMYRLWGQELEKLLADTRLWQSKSTRDMIIMKTLVPSGILKIVQQQIISGTELEEQEPEIPFDDLPLAEKRKIWMAKAREAKRLKKERELAEAEAFRLVEEKKKQEAEAKKQKIFNAVTEEEEETDSAEQAHIEYLRSLNF